MKSPSKKPYDLGDEERADIAEALDEVRRGEFASDEEVTTLFARYDSRQVKRRRQPMRPVR